MEGTGQERCLPDGKPVGIETFPRQRFHERVERLFSLRGNCWQMARPEEGWKKGKVEEEEEKERKKKRRMRNGSRFDPSKNLGDRGRLFKPLHTHCPRMRGTEILVAPEGNKGGEGKERRMQGG